MTVAVNLSPARESLLDKVSLSRTFKLVATGTRRGAGLRGVAFFNPGFVVWPLTEKLNASSREHATNEVLAILTFIRLLLTCEIERNEGLSYFPAALNSLVLPWSERG